MNTKNILAASFLMIIAATSYAGDNTEHADHGHVLGTKTRAQVFDELKASQSDGTYVAGGAEFDAPAIKFQSSKTRAQVSAELKQSKANGSYATSHQDFSGQYPDNGFNSNSSTRIAGQGKAVNY